MAHAGAGSPPPKNPPSPSNLKPDAPPFTPYLRHLLPLRYFSDAFAYALYELLAKFNSPTHLTHIEFCSLFSDIFTHHIHEGSIRWSGGPQSTSDSAYTGAWAGSQEEVGRGKRIDAQSNYGSQPLEQGSCSSPRKYVMELLEATNNSLMKIMSVDFGGDDELKTEVFRCLNSMMNTVLLFLKDNKACGGRSPSGVEVARSYSDFSMMKGGNADLGNMTEIFGDALTKFFSEREDFGGALSHENPWIDANVEILELKPELRDASLKIKTEDYINPRSKKGKEIVCDLEDTSGMKLPALLDWSFLESEDTSGTELSTPNSEHENPYSGWEHVTEEELTIGLS